MNYYELRKQVSETFKKLVSENLSSHFGGNISIRLPDKPDNFLITPSGVRKDKLQPKDLVVIDIDGKLVEGGKKPSIEQFLHLEIYKRRPGVNAIIHAHPIYSSAFAVARMDIPPVIEEYTLMIGGPVKVAEFAPAGSQQLAKNIADALGDRKAVLVANHGVVTCGKNLDDALTVLYSVEKSAMLYIFANSIGKPHVLPDNALRRVLDLYKKRYFT